MPGAYGLNMMNIVSGPHRFWLAFAMFYNRDLQFVVVECDPAPRRRQTVVCRLSGAKIRDYRDRIWELEGVVVAGSNPGLRKLDGFSAYYNSRTGKGLFEFR